MQTDVAVYQPPWATNGEQLAWHCCVELHARKGAQEAGLTHRSLLGAVTLEILLVSQDYPQLLLKQL